MGGDSIHFPFHFMQLHLQFLYPSHLLLFFKHLLPFITDSHSFKAPKYEEKENNFVLLFPAISLRVFELFVLVHKRHLSCLSFLIQYNLWFNIHSINDCVRPLVWLIVNSNSSITFIQQTICGYLTNINCMHCNCF